MSSLISSLQARITAVQERIAAAARAAGRDPASIRLLAISKGASADAIAAARAHGLRAFGESYLQEAVAKIPAARGTPIEADPALVEWHFVGPIQSNKTRPIAETFDWVQSIDRLAIAERLSAQRPAGRPALEVLLQVNISGEASKSGFTPEDAAAGAAAIARLPRLRLRGLMAIPAPQADPELARPALVRMRELFDDLRRQGLDLDTLSLGMSDDLEMAIAAGSTMVRVGTAIFGPRRMA